MEEKEIKAEKNNYVHVTHEFGPVYNHESKILILGSFPSVKSREQQFYYGHRQNRFWRVLANVFDSGDVLDDIDQKRAFLIKHKVAIWDVIASCDIIGSADSTIKNVKENDMRVILGAANIHAIFANGTKAYELFEKYCGAYCTIGIPVKKLPSTSPANAAWSLERLTEAWRKEIRAYL